MNSQSTNYFNSIIDQLICYLVAGSNKRNERVQLSIGKLRHRVRSVLENSKEYEKQSILSSI